MTIDKKWLYNRITFSDDGPKIIRVKNFLFCLPLKFGCIISALVVTLYSVLALTECTDLIVDLARHVSNNSFETVLSFGLAITATLIHTVTVFFTAAMFVGTLKEESNLLRPWIAWISFQWFVYLWIFIYNAVSLAFHDVDSLLPIFYEMLYLAVLFYLLVVVTSFFKNLEEEKTGYVDDTKYQKLENV